MSEFLKSGWITGLGQLNETFHVLIEQFYSGVDKEKAVGGLSVSSSKLIKHNAKRRPHVYAHEHRKVVGQIVFIGTMKSGKITIAQKSPTIHC